MAHDEPDLSPAECDLLESHVVDLALSGKLSKAGREAIEKQKSLGLPRTLSRGHQIVRVYPNGREEVLRDLPQFTYVLPSGVRLLDGD